MKKVLTFFFLLASLNLAFAQVGVPVPTEPANGSAITSLSTTLYWSSVSDITYYDYQCDTTADFDSPILVSASRSRSYTSVSVSNLRMGATYYWRVRARSASDTSAWSDVWSFSTPGSVELVAPENGTTDLPTTTSLSWNKISGSTLYEYQYDEVPTFDSPRLYTGTRSSSYNSVSISNLRYGTTYYWRVRAFNSNLPDTSEWSEIRDFQTIASITLISPANGSNSSDITNTLSWNSISGSNYIYQLDTVPTFDSPVRQSASTTGISRLFSNLHYGKTYYWRVAAYNSSDTSAWSEVWTFTTPAAIELSAPEIGAEVANTLTQRLDWILCTGTTTYQYQLDTVPTFDSPAAFVGTRGSSYNYVSISNLFYENDIYWRVRGWNSVDTSDWSEPWRFTTVGRMQLTSPEDGTNLTLVNQVLSWSTYPGSSTYQYQYDTTAGFNSAALVTGTTSSVSLSASNFHFGARYYWHVRAIDSRDTSAWSDTWTFNPPAAVTLQTPVDESTISTVTQELRWGSIGNSITYQLQYDTSATFTSPILVTYNTTSTYYTAENLCYGARYYWRVRATNSVGTSNWSDVWHFNTQGSVVLVSPENGTDLSSITTSITWNSFTGTSSYQYQYDTVPTFDSPISSMISTSSTSASLTGLHFGKTYYWHVRAINSANASAWSETWTFNTPGNVTLNSPADGFESTTISNTLRWNSVTGTSSYIYEIDTVSTFDSPVYSTNTTTGINVSFSNLYYGKTYYWRVKTQTANSISDWSDTWHFTTPARTALTSPADSTEITTLSQTIYWEICTGTSTYQYQCDTVPTFDSPALLTGTRGSSYNSVSLSGLCFESTNYWHVRCINSVDTSDWSEVWTFNTVGRMTLSSPEDLTALTSITQILSWNSYTGATKYEYQYDTTAAFDSPMAISGTTTSVSRSVSNLVYGATYYWHVRAINSRDTSAWSDTWSFSTPATVELASPVDGYAATSLSSSLQWTGIDGSTYIYEVDTVPTFSSPLYSTYTSSTSVSVSTLYYGKTYYWRVAAYNNVDTSDWSAVWSFTTPARTTLSSPIDGTQLTTLSQYFYWNLLSGTTTYQYQLDTVADFSSPAAFTGTRSSSYDYVSLSNLFFESTIYWRVRCINSVDTSDWSDTWTVVTSGNMTLQSPADGMVLSSTSTSLYWNSYSGASKYQYEYDTTATFDSPAAMRGIVSNTNCSVSNLRYGVTYYWHVRAVNTRDSSAWSDTWTFATPAALSLTSPADGTALTGITNYFSWTSVGNSSYLLQKDTVPTFDSPALTNNSTSSTSISLSNLYYGATHYWRVAAYNSTDTSAWSDVWTFTTPARTTLTSPADGTDITTLTQTISWNTLNGTSTYQYQCDTVSSFDSPALLTGTLSSNSVSISSLCFESTNYWRVRCINSVDTSDWSDVWTFNTVGQMTLYSPLDGTANAGASLSLGWNSYSGATKYQYQYDTTTTFDSPMAITGTTTSTTRTVSSLAYGARYYWHVRAINSRDTSAWSDMWSFTTPATVTLTAPTDGYAATSLTNSLQWSTLSGSTYLYQVDTVPTFSSPLYSTYTTATSISVSTLYYGKTYYWRVAAYNSADTSDWSAAWTFTTPARTTLSSPVDGTQLTSLSQSIYWNTLSGTNTYQYQLDTVADFSSPGIITGTRSSSYNYVSVSNLFFESTIYWRVRCINSVDTSDWSDTWTMVTAGNMTLQSPTDGTALNATTTTLYWNSYTGASNYQYEFDTVATFNSPLLLHGTSSSTSFSASNLYYGATYYWHVRAINVNDSSAWSNTWSFTTPARTTLSTPTDGSVISSLTQSIYWNTISGTSTYQYEYDTVPTFNSSALHTGTRSSSYNYVSLSNLYFESNIYWHVRCINSVDTSDWSDTWHFTTSGSVTLTSPADQTATTGVNVTMQWSGISGCTYIYDMDTVATFSSPYRMTGSTSSTSRSANALYYGTTYYWRVRAVNGNDTSAWSAVWSFNTPAAVTLSSPVNGYVTNATSQSLSWTSITGSTYRYELDETPYFNSPNLRTGTTTSTSKSFSSLAYGNTYYWRIQAYNSSDTSEWSTVWNFTVQSSLFPSAPTLLSPADGSTNIATGGRVLTWTDLANATSYQLQLGTDSTFANNATFVVSYDSYLMNGLMPNTTYYWRVRGVNNNDYSQWSEAWHFTTSNCSTYAPTDIETLCESFTWRGQTFTESGVYRDTIFNTNSCDSIYVLSLTIIHNTYNEITITAQDSYEWNGTTYTTSGDYTQIFTSSNGCDSIAVLHLTITTGIVDNSILAGLKVYPNPTTGEITIHIADFQSISEIGIYDMVGKQVMTTVPYGDDTKLDLSQSKSGMYLLRFVREGRVVGTTKVFVTR